MPGDKATKAKKVASRRRVTTRQVVDKKQPERTDVPSPKTLRKWQAAYEEALKRSIKTITKKEKMPARTPAVKSRRAVKATPAKPAATGGKSVYQKFVQKKMKQPDMKGLPATERMRLIASLWKEEKLKK